MKALIFIHGFCSDKDDFKVIYERIKDQYDYISLTNLPGHSNQNLSGFNCVDTIIHVKDLCKEVFSKYEVVDIVGYSMGGAITTMLSLEFNFNKIVLVSPANRYNGFANTYKQIPIYFKSMFKKNNKAKSDSEKITNETKHALSLFSTNFQKFHTNSFTSFMQVIDYCNEKLSNSEKKLDNLSIIYGLLDQIIPVKSIDFLNKHCDNVHYHEIPYANHFLLISDYADYVATIIEDELIEVTLDKLMSFKKFCLLGDTNNKEKVAYKIKNELLKNNYELTDDINTEFEVLNLCMHPAKSFELLKNSQLNFRYVLIQPGAESDEIKEFLNKKNISYIEGCSLKGLELTK